MTTRGARTASRGAALAVVVVVAMTATTSLALEAPPTRAPTTTHHHQRHLIAALAGVPRGGAFDFAARETGELCGLAHPEEAVVGAIVASARWTLARRPRVAAVFGRGLAVRGGAFDWHARETGEMFGLADPEGAVVSAIVGSAKFSVEVARKIVHAGPAADGRGPAAVDDAEEAEERNNPREDDDEERL
eukprot:CAMPEP_0185701012 /NCGR_PEP_ID=MMETSP1164-20130828/8255_1 /TAXON_ID=1104430 /ORGANISM="Chrysoreinhardia sp, Strain CCMP2950" /LENGTH=189 /DNA_ID=CAMNT_0028367987 /DNA_START=67 /DNA_END=636 /DNA_ORIENTATION=+